MPTVERSTHADRSAEHARAGRCGEQASPERPEPAGRFSKQICGRGASVLHAARAERHSNLKLTRVKIHDPCGHPEPRFQQYRTVYP